jgi:hypothetical protein
MQETGEEGILREYLLGRLDLLRRQGLEQELLTDGKLARRLEDAQDHLIDDYAFKALSEAERESFERHFLMTPERLHKLRISQALDDYVRRHPRPARGSSWWRNLLRPFSPGGLKVLVPAGVLALCIAAVLFLWRFDWRHMPGGDLARSRQIMQAGVERANREQPPGGAVRTVTLLLKPGLERAKGGPPRRAVIAAGTSMLQLDLEVPSGEPSRYSILMTTEEGTELFSYGGISPRPGSGAPVISLRTPAEYLPTGDYRAIVTGGTAVGGATEVGQYPFQVVNNTVSP